MENGRAREIRRVWNPPNPFVGEHREWLEEPPEAELEIYQDSSKSILSENASPDLEFRWSVNPYRGCFHACAYCYARTTHEYFGLGAGTDFERKLFVKPNAPELLARAFERKSWKGELVAFSGVTDCYQPLEASWKLTRGCLNVCLAYGNPLGIVTKSRLIRRDLDLLADLAAEKLVRVMISIPFASEEVTRKMEPGTPTVARRFETVRALADAGIPVGVLMAPIIPGLNDPDIPEILTRARESGAESAGHMLLRLSGNVEPVFFHRLEEQFPLRAKKIESRLRDTRSGRLTESRFGKRWRGEGAYWNAIEEVWTVWRKRVGFPEKRAGSPPERKPGPRRGRQLGLFAEVEASPDPREAP